MCVMSDEDISLPSFSGIDKRESGGPRKREDRKFANSPQVGTNFRAPLTFISAMTWFEQVGGRVEDLCANLGALVASCLKVREFKLDLCLNLLKHQRIFQVLYNILHTYSV